jgi:hypothetical protein
MEQRSRPGRSEWALWIGEEPYVLQGQNGQWPIYSESTGSLTPPAARPAPSPRRVRPLSQRRAKPPTRARSPVLVLAVAVAVAVLRLPCTTSNFSAPAMKAWLRCSHKTFSTSSGGASMSLFFYFAHKLSSFLDNWLSHCIAVALCTTDWTIRCWSKGHGKIG